MIPVTFDTVATLQFGSEGHPTSLHFAIPEEWKPANQTPPAAQRR